MCVLVYVFACMQMPEESVECLLYHSLPIPLRQVSP